MTRTWIVLALAGIVLACSFVFAQPANTKQHAGSAPATVKAAPPVIVYYFHTERRCATCIAVEKTAKDFVDRVYKDDKRVSFKSANVEEVENSALAEKYQAAGSMLLVVRGDKTEDLTADAFKYARANPEKLESRIKETVAALLK